MDATHEYVGSANGFFSSRLAGYTVHFLNALMKPFQGTHSTMMERTHTPNRIGTCIGMENIAAAAAAVNNIRI